MQPIRPVDIDAFRLNTDQAPNYGKLLMSSFWVLQSVVGSASNNLFSIRFFLRNGKLFFVQQKVTDANRFIFVTFVHEKKVIAYSTESCKVVVIRG